MLTNFLEWRITGYYLLVILTAEVNGKSLKHSRIYLISIPD